MRRLDLLCDGAAVHYRAAQDAITAAGSTKGFGKGIKLDHESGWTNGDPELAQYEFEAQRGSHGDVNVFTWCGSCRVFFIFTWPELRLTYMEVLKCTCGGRK